jgi:DNA-binding HxlR family transcriptional regulator
MTTKNQAESTCPAEGLLKTLSGKWKPQIFRFAVNGYYPFQYIIERY